MTTAGAHRSAGGDAAPGAPTVLLLSTAGLVYVGSVVVFATAGLPVGLVVAAAGAQLAMLSAGTAIVLRSHARRLGWLLVLTGATLLYWAASQEVPRDGVIAGLAHSVGPLTVLPFMLVIAAFPNPRATTRLGRGVERFAVVVGGGSVLLMVAATLGWIGGEWTAYRALFDVAVLVTVVGTIANQALTYRRRPRVEQQQVKYFALVMFVGASQLLGFWLGIPGLELLDPVMPGVISVTILLAITRYRLYEIDRFISRTLAYALVLGLLALLFVGSVTGITALVPTQDSLAVAVTTIAVVTLFDPLRRRVVDAVDRRFNRTRYVAQQVVEGFGRDVQDVTDLDEIGDRVHDVVSATLAPSTVAVWHPSAGVRA